MFVYYYNQENYKARNVLTKVCVGTYLCALFSTITQKPH